ncbi:MAG: isoaspartyl peptidase/L-asparaginase family protein [Gemmatimonadaceae bacterium]
MPSINRLIFSCCLTGVLGATASAQTEHARFDFPATIGGRQHILTYDGTHDVSKDADPRIKLVIFVHHGGSQNPTTYFKHLTTALDAADRDRPTLGLKATTLVIAPGMIGPQHVADRPSRYANGHYPIWNGGWREGADAINAPAVSNFDLLDAMVRQVVKFYPGVKAVVHVGHSAGGQLLSRYALGSPVYDELRARGIFVRYLVANPSSVLYFDRQRPDLIAEKSFVDYRSRVPFVDGGECLEFNTYKYGLDKLVPYMTRRPVAAMLASFRQRELYMFQGLEDRDPMGDGVDRDCPALLQGRFRLERGKRYYEYLGHFFGQEIYKTKFVAFAPGIAHSGGQMFLSAPGKAIIFVNADSAAAALRAQTSQAQPSFALAIHGGGGVRTRAEFAANPKLEAAYRDGLKQSLAAGYEVLKAGGSAVEAVEAAIMVMEDSPLFNAGKGASFTRDGTVELDAAIMNGKTMRAGGVAAVRRIKNPINLARIVLEQTPHVLIVGEGAGALAQERGIPWVPESYFYTEEKWNELHERLTREVPFGTPIPPASDTTRRRPPNDSFDRALWGTVGAVALDATGNLAAGTSTGGRIIKRPGRVGDSPIIGAGTYANNNTAAVSTTGLGEYQMVLLTAKEISSLMQYRGMSLSDAADNAVKVQLVQLGGGGGAVAIDKAGNIATPFTGDGMYRGWVRQDGKIEVRIFDR